MSTFHTLVVIQARFSSKRLAGKVMLPVAGVPMIVYLMRRLKTMPQEYKVIVATTTKTEDNVLAALAAEEGFDCIRGEEDDLLARYIRCLNVFDADVITRVTADNPLTDPMVIKTAVRRIMADGSDYVNATLGLPRGIGVDVFSKQLIKASFLRATSEYDREHINAYVLKNRANFKIADFAAPAGFCDTGLSFTVDTYDDYCYVKEIIESFPQGGLIRTDDAIKRARQGDIQRKVSA